MKTRIDAEVLSISMYRVLLCIEVQVILRHLTGEESFQELLLFFPVNLVCRGRNTSCMIREVSINTCT